VRDEALPALSVFRGYESRGIYGGETVDDLAELVSRIYDDPKRVELDKAGPGLPRVFQDAITQREDPLEEDELNEWAMIAGCGCDSVSGFFDDINPVHIIRSAARWAGHAVRDVGHAIHTATHAVAHAVDVASHAVAKIPIIGGPLHIALDLTPFKLADSIASGARLDHAFLDEFKRNIASAREAAPYAQTIVSMVPGVGTGVAAAIAAGSALAQGRPITEAVLAGIKGAVPGGAAGALAFDTAHALAMGKNPTKAVLEAARAQLPEAARPAFDIGMAVASGRKLQAALVDGVKNMATNQLGKLAQLGAGELAKSPILMAAHNLVPEQSQAGFKAAAGLLSHSGVPELAIVAARSKLGPAARHGFDEALKAYTRRFPKMATNKILSKPRNVGLIFSAAHDAVGLTKAEQLLDLAQGTDAKKRAEAKKVILRTDLAARAGHPEAKRGHETLSAAAAARRLRKYDGKKFAYEGPIVVKDEKGHPHIIHGRFLRA
jgi:hypothetical protein